MTYWYITALLQPQTYISFTYRTPDKFLVLEDVKNAIKASQKFTGSLVILNFIKMSEEEFKIFTGAAVTPEGR